MEKPKINVPEITVLSPSKLNPKPKDIKSWLHQLPQADLNACSSLVTEALVAYNRCLMSSNDRLMVLNHFSGVVQELIKGQSYKYKDSAFPLSERNRVRCDHVNRLLDEMATGFKWLVAGILEENERKNTINPELFEVVRITLVYLSKRMLSAYTTYSAEPAHLWQDMHQLYKVVESIGARLDPKRNQKILADIKIIERTYLRIVMLSITNPYHLMQGESQLIFNYLNKWVEGCNVVPLQGYALKDGDLLIDLDSDNPPQFILSKDVAHSRHCRTVDMKELMERFHAAVDGLTTRKGKALKNIKLSFNERMRRDMLIRLRNVWVGRLKRLEERQATDNDISLVAGLSASHFFIDGEKEFYPESDEIQIHKPQQGEFGLSLVTDEMEDWQFDDEKTKVNAEMQRLSRFNANADVWEQIFSSKSHARAMLDANAVKHHSFTWHKRNESEHGVGLRNVSGDNVKLNVGNIVSFHPENDDKQWCLGMVTWLKEYASDHLDIGVQYIKGVPMPVAVRAISGTGGGSEYFRALLFKSEGDEHFAKVMVPAAMYDVGTQLVLNFRRELRYIRLVDVARTSSSCTMFGFHEIEIPLVEQSKIKKIKEAS